MGALLSQSGPPLAERPRTTRDLDSGPSRQRCPWRVFLEGPAIFCAEGGSLAAGAGRGWSRLPYSQCGPGGSQGLVLFFELFRGKLTSSAQCSSFSFCLQSHPCLKYKIYRNSFDYTLKTEKTTYLVVKPIEFNKILSTTLCSTFRTVTRYTEYPGWSPNSSKRFMTRKRGFSVPHPSVNWGPPRSRENKSQEPVVDARRAGKSFLASFQDIRLSLFPNCFSILAKETASTVIEMKRGRNQENRRWHICFTTKGAKCVGSPLQQQSIRSLSLMNSVFFFFLSREREDDCGAKEKGWGGRARAGASRIHDDDSFGNETLGERILSENTLLTRKKPNTELICLAFCERPRPFRGYNNDVKQHA